MAAALKLSVIVPTHNRREILVSRTLPALFHQDLPASEYEIIVVVDGSSDGTPAALERLRAPCFLRIIEQPNRGPGAARNRGIQAARGNLLLFIDDDIICGPGLLKQHVDAHNEPEPAVVYGSISLEAGSPASIMKHAIEAWYRDYYQRIESQGKLQWPRDDYLISNSSIPRARLLHDGFDEKMPAKEDYELGLRLWKDGTRFKYLPKAQAYEYYAKRSGYVLRNDGESFGKTDVLLSRKHSEYRPYSSLAAMGNSTAWKRLWRRACVRAPAIPLGLLRLPIWICDRLCRFPRMQRTGHHLLGVGRGIVELHSAAKEVGSWNSLRSEFGMRLPVFLYHHVGPSRPGTVAGLTVSPGRFASHMRWLARRGFQGIRPADWARWRREGKGLPEKPVLITFDDGYADLVEHALPVLQRYGFGAAVYIVTAQLGGTNAWDEARGCSTMRLMTADQICHWAARGIEFGAHSRTHADLTALRGDELLEEAQGSGQDLERVLGSRVVSFAYPYGFHNQAVNDCVRGAFELAFIADDNNEGLNDLQTDPHLLLRTMVQSRDSLLATECRARWGHNPFLNLRGRIALRSRLKRTASYFLPRGRVKLKPEE
jgi:glycosyltransferase involved in cell wall biosynthesis/peptidoglycan/xylan/chitin deacetylase (PgdA/CDA1 family)